MVMSLLKRMVSFLGLKTPEFAILVVVIAGVGLIIYYNNSYVDAKVEQQITEREAEVSEALNTFREERRRLNHEIINEYIERQRILKERQQKVVDTTFLEFFNREPIEEETATDTSEDTQVTQNPTPPTHQEETDETIIQPLSDRQLDALYRGMRESYCLALTGGAETDCDR